MGDCTNWTVQSIVLSSFKVLHEGNSNKASAMDITIIRKGLMNAANEPSFTKEKISGDGNTLDAIDHFDNNCNQWRLKNNI